MKVYLVVRTVPSLAIMGAFSLRDDADACIARLGGEGMLVEEWTVA